MKCKSCQKEISADFKMCPYCGEPVALKSDENENQLSPAALEAIRVKKELEAKFNLQHQINEEADDLNETEIEETNEINEEEIEENSEQYEDEPKRKKEKKKKRGNKKGILIALAMLVIVAAGVFGYFFFNASPLNQNIKEIEAGSIVDPLTLVSLGSKNEDKYTFEVKENAINANVPGEYTIIYTLTNKDNDKSKEVSFKFKVVDTTPPEITANDPVKTTMGKEFDITKAITVTDKVDGVIDPKNVSVQGTVDTTKKGAYQLTLTVSDKAGNKAEKTVNVSVADMGDSDVFFNNISGSWLNSTTKVVCKFSLKNGAYFLNIGRYQSEGYAEGALTFTDVNGDNTIADFNWDYTSYTNEEPPKYSAVEKRTVVVDTGTPKDDKISIDLGDGNGLKEYTFLSD